MTGHKEAKDSQEQLARLQAIEQALHSHSAQRNANQSQMLETENAIRELSETKESYRIIGNIMVKTDPAKLKKELDEKKESLNARMASGQKQEQRLREELQSLQDQLLKGAHE